MKTRYAVIPTVSALIVLASIVCYYWSKPSDIAAVRNRSTQMHEALKSGDISAAQNAIAPQFRRKAAFRKIGQPEHLAGTRLGSTSTIIVARDLAFVSPPPQL